MTGIIAKCGSEPDFAQDRSAMRGRGWDVKSEASMCSPNRQQTGLLAMTIHTVKVRQPPLTPSELRGMRFEVLRLYDL